VVGQGVEQGLVGQVRVLESEAVLDDVVEPLSLGVVASRLPVGEEEDPLPGSPRKSSPPRNGAFCSAGTKVARSMVAATAWEDSVLR